MSDLSPDYMAKLAGTYGDPDAFSRLVFGTGLHAGQRRYTENATADVNFLLPGNSFGKTELICRFATYLAWFKESDQRPVDFESWLSQEWKGLIASYVYDIAKESFDRFDNYCKNRPELQSLVKRVSRADPVEVEFHNGAVLTWGSLKDQGKGVEAARRRVIFVDEAGHIPELAYVFDSILFPRTMGVSGRIHLFGTPKPHSDPYLLEVYQKGRGPDREAFYYSQDGTCLENEFWPEAERVRVLANPRYVTGWTDCPNLGIVCNDILCREGKHPILTAMGRQVIKGEFIIAGGYFFSRPHIQRVFTGDHEVVWNGLNEFRSEPKAGRLYMGAFDLGGNKARKRKKRGSDPTVGFVIDYTDRPWKIAAYFYIEGGDMDWEQKYQLMADVFHGYSMPYLLIDATGQVDSVQEALQVRGVEVEGVQFGGSSSRKFDMLRNLQLVLEMEWSGSKGVLRSPLIEKLKYELDHYVLPDDDIQQDTVMALAMCTHHIAQWELPAPVGGEVY